jgi:hypothetical protein
MGENSGSRTVPSSGNALSWRGIVLLASLGALGPKPWRPSRCRWRWRAKPSCCEESNFGPLPDFPQRLRAAGIDEEDFKMVFQICKDNEKAKLKCINISLPVMCVAWPCLIYYFSVVVHPEEGARKFNSKYKEKNIK